MDTNAATSDFLLYVDNNRETLEFCIDFVQNFVSFGIMDINLVKKGLRSHFRKNPPEFFDMQSFKYVDFFDVAKHYVTKTEEYNNEL